MINLQLLESLLEAEGLLLEQVGHCLLLVKLPFPLGDLQAPCLFTSYMYNIYGFRSRYIYIYIYQYQYQYQYIIYRYMYM